MSLLQDMKDLTRQYDDLYKEQLQDNTINNEKEMKDIQFQLFMLTTKQEQEIQNLVDRLNYYKEKYNQGQPVISDEDYDKLYFELAELEHWTGIVLENSPTRFQDFENLSLKNINYDYTKFIVPQENNNQQELIQMFHNINSVAIINPEGIDCFLEYKNGYLFSAVAYEKNIINKNITDFILCLSPLVPRRINYKNDLIIHGKLTCLCYKINNILNNNTIHNFLLQFLTTFSSDLFFTTDFKNFSFYVIDIIKGLEEKFNALYPKICYLNFLGFYISPSVPLNNLNEYLIDFIKWQGHEQQISFSNILFYLNQPQKNDINNNKIISYKCYELNYKRKYLNLGWKFNDSQDNCLRPVIIHTPIKIDDQIIRQTFLPIGSISQLKNALQIIQDNNFNIEIYQSKYIPASLITNQDLFSLKHSFDLYDIVPLECPYCQTKVELEDQFLQVTESSGFDFLKNIKCNNPLCIGKPINKLKHFVGKNGLNITGLSDEIIDWLFTKKWIYKIYDIYTLEMYRKEWSVETNFDKTIVNDLLQAIEDSKKCSFSDFISALGIPLIDKDTAIKIANYFKRYENFIKMIYENNYDFVNILGLTKKQQESLLNFDYTEADFLWRILKYGEIPYHEKNYFYMPLRQKTYVVVGPAKYFDSVEWLCGYIHGEGGAVVTEVTEDVDYVINNDPESNCPENIAARELGIPIITEQEFLGNIY